MGAKIVNFSNTANCVFFTVLPSLSVLHCLRLSRHAERGASRRLAEPILSLRRIFPCHLASVRVSYPQMRMSGKMLNFA
jgi:hypothetical protein